MLFSQHFFILKRFIKSKRKGKKKQKRDEIFPFSDFRSICSPQDGAAPSAKRRISRWSIRTLQFLRHSIHRKHHSWKPRSGSHCFIRNVFLTIQIFWRLDRKRNGARHELRGSLGSVVQVRAFYRLRICLRKS
jgi:hypothetical protein